MTGVDAFTARNAIECLRAGAPNQTVVELLGSGQPRIEDAFSRLLTAVRGGATTGLSVGGGFGAGKSHLLAALRQRALREGFAVSMVVISKETLLSDPCKVASAALATAAARERRGPLLADIAAELSPANRAHADLRRWAEDPASGLDSRFAATLHLHAHAHGVDDVLTDAVVRFWSGDSLPAADLTRALRANGLPATGFRRVHPAELARQRLRFAQRLMAAAGYCGWIVLFDEVELIGRCTPAQRARSYAEIARWTGGSLGGPAAIGSVFAITEDFAAAVLDGKGDRSSLAGRAQWAEQPAELVAEGMRVIDRDTLLLDRPDADRLRQVYRRVRELHGTAFNWNPPNVRGLPGASTHQFRQHIRGWINEWDLLRLDPDYRPDTLLDTEAHDYSHA
ncbi:BREX system ATP-binding domain-containing protein [Actinosynnema sp. CS-041913]|uniref:BREX system ATP-binding domain-containing protein n=1 Tax=Actinosynnema sp. CS-041913 TaxID=3239917 RepID=UPI003D89B6A6